MLITVFYEGILSEQRTTISFQFDGILTRG